MYFFDPAKPKTSFWGRAPRLDAAGNAFYKRNRQRCLHLKRWKEGKSTQWPFSPSRQSTDQISGIRRSKNFRPCFCPSPQTPPSLLNGQEARKVNGPLRAPNPRKPAKDALCGKNEKVYFPSVFRHERTLLSL